MQGRGQVRPSERTLGGIAALVGKLDALKDRFGDHTDAIFKRHNLKSVGYWIPQENPDNLFIYILEHPSKAEADKNWDAIQKDPDFVSSTVPFDFHLSANAANDACCVDKIKGALDGGATSLPDHDFDGSKRPKGTGWDIGAHEAI